MKRTKTFAQAFPCISLLAVTGVFFLLAGCSGCNCPPATPCPSGSHCQADIPGGGTTPIALGGTVIEIVGASSSKTHGDTVYYTSGSYSYLDTTKPDGTYGADTAVTFWDGTHIMYHLSFKHSINAFDEIIYNKLGAPPFNDLTHDTFTITGAGTTIPVTIYAQKSDRSPCNGAVIQIKDASPNNVPGSCTTGATGICTYGSQLNQGCTYWMYVTGACGATRFQFTTAAPLDVMPVNMCNLRIYVRL